MNSSAVLYLRFSPRPDAEEARSIIVQEEACRKYCSINNLKVVRVVKDPETSARKMKLCEREGGKELIEIVDQGIASNIVVQKMDRLFRSIDGRIVMDTWANRGVNLHLADQGGNSINCGTAMGRFLAGQILLFAELEPAMISERTSSAMKSHQRAGRRMSSRIPYGKKLGPIVDGRQTLVDDTDEQVIINVIVTRATYGETVPDTIEFLEGRKMFYRGKPWHPENVRRILRREGLTT